MGALALGACQPQLEERSGGLGAIGGSSHLGGAGRAGAGGAPATGGAPAAGGTTPLGDSTIEPSAPPASVPSTGGSTGSCAWQAGTGGPAPYLDPSSCLVQAPIATTPISACGSVDSPSSAGASGAANGGATPTEPLFCDQFVWNQAPAPANRTLYSWTTAEQAAELRADPSVLLTRSETPDLGRGYAFTAIDALAALGSAPENLLLQKLSDELFVKVRYAWPNAWATRMGWPGEDYGDQLLRIVLKPEAWIVVVYDGQGMAVIDMNNQLVSIADAVAHSERIAAVYFYKQEITGNGTFQACSGGYREFIVGNEAMIEEWSLGTEDIRDRILADAALIDAFLVDIRPMPPAVDAASFNQDVVCYWDDAASNEVGRYEHALSIPSEYYLPLPEQLANLSQTLRASVFEPDPLVVRAGE